MRVHVFIDNQEYISSDNTEHTEKFVNELYENINIMDRLKLNLDKGGYLILPKKAFERCIIVVK